MGLDSVNIMIKHGSLVISLDFEMMWGIIDVFSKEGYGQTNVRQVPEVINRMIALFEKYGVHATFATVGMIMYPNRKELEKDLPDVHPSYADTKMSPYENDYISQIKLEEENLFFCPDIVKEICSRKGFELGSHTYCHYYCWAPGQTAEQFDVDVQKSVEVSKGYVSEIKTIIFPRNQVSDEHLKICGRRGLQVYRGNAIKFFSEPRNRFDSIRNRICRLLDTYVNVGGHTTVPYSQLEYKEGMLNVRASRMLRPYIPKLSIFESLRLRRIRKEMIHAAQKGEMYHLWWHPHNFGTNMNENFNFLEKILETYKYCHERYGMQSYTMSEIYQEVAKNK